MTDEEMIARIADRLRMPGPPIIGPCPRCKQPAEYLDRTGTIVLCPICAPLALEAVKRQRYEDE
jgi:uncharacterized Zn finger protein (UPF0148 family)